MRAWSVLILSAALAAAAGCPSPFGADGNRTDNPYEMNHPGRFEPENGKKGKADKKKSDKDGKKKPPPWRGKDGKKGDGDDDFDEKSFESARDEEAQVLFEKANELIDQKEYRRAEILLARAANMNKKEPAYLSDLGRVRYWQGEQRYGDARQAYTDALRLLDEYTPADRQQESLVVKAEAVIYTNLGDLFRDWDRPNEALEAYDKALHRAPNMTRLSYEIGYLQLKLGQFKEAESRFNLVLNRVTDADDPLVIKARTGLAVTYHLAGYPRRAYEQITRIEDQGWNVNPKLRAEIVEAAKRGQVQDSDNATAWNR